jgi:hypothetical protein
MIRWLTRDRTGAVRRVEGTPLAVRVVDAPPEPEMPPRPPLAASSAQWGIHDPRFDPSGAPAIAIRESKRGRS